MKPLNPNSFRGSSVQNLTTSLTCRLKRDWWGGRMNISSLPGVVTSREIVNGLDPQTKSPVRPLNFKYSPSSQACPLANSLSRELAEWQQLPSTMSPYYSTHDHVVEPPSILNRVIAGLPGGLAVQIQRLWDTQSYSSISTHQSRIPRPLRNAQRWNLRRLLNLPHLLVAIWALLLLWGERWVFKSALEACEWGTWERWVSSVVF